MGGFDTFSNKADEYGRQAKDAVSGKRKKAADPDSPEQVERGMQQERQQRGGVKDDGRRRMDQESNEEHSDDDNWA